jgi:uncharacterized protein YneF (UPF0154 family)
MDLIDLKLILIIFSLLAGFIYGAYRWGKIRR